MLAALAAALALPVSGAPPTDKGKGGGASLQPLVIVDANGVVVGPYLPNSVYVRASSLGLSLDGLAAIQLTNGASPGQVLFTHFLNGYVYFDQQGCTGNAYIGAPVGFVQLATATERVNGAPLLYVAGATPTQQGIDLQSRRLDDSCQNLYMTGGLLYPVQTVIDLSTLFTEPLKLR